MEEGWRGSKSQCSGMSTMLWKCLLDMMDSWWTPRLLWNQSCHGCPYKACTGSRLSTLWHRGCQLLSLVLCVGLSLVTVSVQSFTWLWGWDCIQAKAHDEDVATPVSVLSLVWVVVLGLLLCVPVFFCSPFWLDLPKRTRGCWAWLCSDLHVVILQDFFLCISV